MMNTKDLIKELALRRPDLEGTLKTLAPEAWAPDIAEPIKMRLSLYEGVHFGIENNEGRSLVWAKDNRIVISDFYDWEFTKESDGYCYLNPYIKGHAPSTLTNS